MQDEQYAKHGTWRGLAPVYDGISARDVLQAAPEPMLLVGQDGEIVLANELAEQLFGYRRSEMEGRPIEMLGADAYREGYARQRAAYAAEPRRRTLDTGFYGRRKNGTQFPAELSISPLVTPKGQILIVAVRDISDRKRAEAEHRLLLRERALFAEVSRLARQDPLTGLPNRTMLQDRLATAIAAANRHGHRLAVLFLDLDGFKRVNDSLGHAAGDVLLRSVADRLTASVRRSDTVSRLGGDEFVVLLSEVRHDDDVARGAGKVMDAIRAAHAAGGEELFITASIGVAVYPEDGDSVEELVRNADVAMYHAKERGRDNWQVFGPAMNTTGAERRALEEGLRRALDRDELLLHYQPRVDLTTGETIGAEALVRWRHPERGLLEPGSFVPVAEECGLMVPIGRWVLHEACRQASEWQTRGLRPLPVAVNISASEFRSEGFPDTVRRILGETRLEPHFLELELTERALMESAHATTRTLQALKALGVRLAIDDFGGGYSSLSYLLHCPIDALSVDRSFVREISAHPAGCAAIAAVIAMGKSLKHRVVAEGVETGEQLAFLQAHECEEGQGYHFSRPLSATQFAARLAC